MIYYWISHRGNLTKRNPKRENSPDYIDEAIHHGFSVEIDLQYDDCYGLGLGHDKIQYPINFQWLCDRTFKLFIHCKTLSSLDYMMEKTYGWRDYGDLNFFFHDKDDAVITTQGHIWTYPGKELIHNSIGVLPETVEDWDIKNAAGICSDRIVHYKGLHNNV